MAFSLYPNPSEAMRSDDEEERGVIAVDVLSQSMSVWDDKRNNKNVGICSMCYSTRGLARCLSISEIIDCAEMVI